MIKSKPPEKQSNSSSDSSKKSFRGIKSYSNKQKKPILIKRQSNIVNLSRSILLCVKFFKLTYNNLKKSKV